MKKIFLSLLIFACMASNAQTIVKGDMNDDGVVDVSDVTITVSTILGNTLLQTINLANNPYEVDNSAVVGTWWKTKYESVTFGDDGTTDVEGADAYVYQPFLGRIVFYKSGVPVTLWNVVDVSAEALSVNPAGIATVQSYTKAVPVQLVTGITLNFARVILVPDKILYLTATILPSDADNPSVSWSSSDVNVVEVNQSGRIIANSVGSATITCSATDGSGVKATCEVTIYSDNSGSIGGRDYVDLGLPSRTLWATCNIGAESPEDYGDYIAWGETEPQEENVYSWASYKYAIDAFNLTKYCSVSSSGNNGFTDNLTELELSDDASYVNLGSSWRMPSQEQFDELINSEYTSSVWTTQNGVNGRKITSNSNGNSIFLPAAGLRYTSILMGAGSGGYYWSRTLSSDKPYYAWSLVLSSNGVYTSSDNANRSGGQSVRPVRLSE